MRFYEAELNSTLVSQLYGDGNGDFNRLKIKAAGSVTVEANCVIGGQAGIADHVYLCEGVIVASKSGVTKNIFKPGTYAGFPAEPARGFWAQQAALRRLINKAKKAK